MLSLKRAVPAAVAVFCAVAVWSEEPPHSELVYPGPDGTLHYASTQTGDTVLDFSNCGYRGGGIAIPDVAVQLTLEPGDENTDDTERIQKAVDRVAAMPADNQGWRGAVLLKRGTYRVAGTLHIQHSGIVLRGEGQHHDGTVILATGTEKRTVIDVRGANGPEVTGNPIGIVDERVPVGARTFALEDASGLAAGDTVYVVRRGNEEWIRAIDMDRILPRMRKRPDGTEYDQTKQWQPFDLRADRVVTAVKGNRITVDAPVACAIEARWGGGYVVRYDAPGRIEYVGVEALRGVSEFAESVTATRRGETYYSDEKHAWIFVRMQDVANAWARNLTARHFGLGCVTIGSGAKWITVQDSACIDQVSVLTGSRRYPFLNSRGELILFMRCVTDDTPRHPFALGARLSGPNAFVDCLSKGSYALSEPHHRWSVGGLFDNVRCRIALQDRQNYGTGHGWSGANYVAWNTEGLLICQQPPTAQNFAIGHVGEKDPGAFRKRGIRWAEERPGEPVPVQMNQRDGWWEHHGSHVTPRSLYLKQLEDRLGAQAVRAIATEAQLAGTVYDALDALLAKSRE